MPMIRLFLQEGMISYQTVLLKEKLSIMTKTRPVSQRQVKVNLEIIWCQIQTGLETFSPMQNTQHE